MSCNESQSPNEISLRLSPFAKRTLAGIAGTALDLSPVERGGLVSEQESTTTRFSFFIADSLVDFALAGIQESPINNFEEVLCFLQRWSIQNLEYIYPNPMVDQSRCIHEGFDSILDIASMIKDTYLSDRRLTDSDVKSVLAIAIKSHYTEVRRAQTNFAELGVWTTALGICNVDPESYSTIFKRKNGETFTSSVEFIRAQHALIQAYRSLPDVDYDSLVGRVIVTPESVVLNTSQAFFMHRGINRMHKRYTLEDLKVFFKTGKVSVQRAIDDSEYFIASSYLNRFRYAPNTLEPTVSGYDLILILENIQDTIINKTTKRRGYKDVPNIYQDDSRLSSYIEERRRQIVGMNMHEEGRSFIIRYVDFMHKWQLLGGPKYSASRIGEFAQIEYNRLRSRLSEVQQISQLKNVFAFREIGLELSTLSRIQRLIQQNKLRDLELINFSFLNRYRSMSLLSRIDTLASGLFNDLRSVLDFNYTDTDSAEELDISEIHYNSLQYLIVIEGILGNTADLEKLSRLKLTLSQAETAIIGLDDPSYIDKCSTVVTAVLKRLKVNRAFIAPSGHQHLKNAVIKSSISAGIPKEFYFSRFVVELSALGYSSIDITRILLASEYNIKTYGVVLQKIIIYARKSLLSELDRENAVLEEDV